MERAARVGVDALTAAELSAAGADGGFHGPDIRFLDDAEARAFEFRRQTLVVGDVLPDTDRARTLRRSMASLADTLDAGVRALRQEPGASRRSEHARAELERLTLDAEALLRDSLIGPGAAGGG